jgi:hypothetical protein
MTASLFGGCGSSGGAGGGGSAASHNNAVIQQARSSETSVASLRAKISNALQLHTYAGVPDAFTVPPGGPDVLLGQSGNECSIDNIVVGDQAKQYLNDRNALISPDGRAAVKVGPFQGTPDSVCLEAVRHALHW